MKKIITLVLISVIASCSANKGLNEVSNQVISFAESSGKIEMEVDKKGEWVYIQSLGSSPLLSDDNHAIEQAFNAATMRAKANLSEFLTNEIKSDKSTSTTIGLKKEAEEQRKLDSEVVEKISSNSKSILKGVYVTERKISDDRTYVIVKIKTDKKTLKAINSIK